MRFSMEVSRNINFNKSIGFVALWMAIAFLYSCNLVSPHIVYAEAEITGISSQSDTSVIVKIDTHRNSSAYTDCFLVLTVDTVATENLQGDPPYPHPVSQECKLDGHYELAVGGLVKGRMYIFQLFSAGTFDIGSPKTEYLSKETGTRWEYAIP